MFAGAGVTRTASAPEVEPETPADQSADNSAELRLGRLGGNKAAERQQSGTAARGLPPEGVLAHVVSHVVFHL
jgi:hypothetical protein